MNAEMYQRMAAAIIELAAATDAEMEARAGPFGPHRTLVNRLLAAKEAIAQLAKELS